MVLTLKLNAREEIQTRRAHIEAQYEALAAEEAALKILCAHPAVEKKYDGDGGSYYDPPTYWINWTCPDCGKRWTTDQ